MLRHIDGVEADPFVQRGGLQVHIPVVAPSGGWPGPRVPLSVQPARPPRVHPAHPGGAPLPVWRKAEGVSTRAGGDGETTVHPNRKRSLDMARPCDPPDCPRGSPLQGRVKPPPGHLEQFHTTRRTIARITPFYVVAQNSDVLLMCLQQGSAEDLGDDVCPVFAKPAPCRKLTHPPDSPRHRNLGEHTPAPCKLTEPVDSLLEVAVSAVEVRSLGPVHLVEVSKISHLREQDKARQPKEQVGILDPLEEAFFCHVTRESRLAEEPRVKDQQGHGFEPARLAGWGGSPSSSGSSPSSWITPEEFPGLPTFLRLSSPAS